MIKIINMMTRILKFKKNELQLVRKDNFAETVTHYVINRVNNGAKILLKPILI